LSEDQGLDPYPYAFIPLAGALAFILGLPFDDNKARWIWPLLWQVASIVVLAMVLPTNA